MQELTDLSSLPGGNTLITVQVRLDFYQCAAAKCQKFHKLRNRLGMRFSVEKLAPMDQFRCYPSVCNMNDEYLFVTGGTDHYCERYSIAEGTWQPMLFLNHARQRHASCAMENYIYVFWGRRLVNSDEQDDEPILTIERLKTDFV